MHLIGKSIIILFTLSIIPKEKTMNTHDPSTTSIEYIRYKIEASRHDRFVEDYRKAAEYLQASRYCLGYELSQGEEEPSNFIVRIEWTSTEDHLQGFRKSEDFPKFLACVRAYYNDIQEMKHYQKSDVVFQRGGMTHE